MGTKLAAFYEQTAKEFGSTGRVKLALLTKLSSAKALEAPDTPEAIKLFEESLEQLRRTMPPR